MNMYYWFTSWFTGINKGVQGIMSNYEPVMTSDFSFIYMVLLSPSANSVENDCLNLKHTYENSCLPHIPWYRLGLQRRARVPPVRTTLLEPKLMTKWSIANLILNLELLTHVHSTEYISFQNVSYRKMKKYIYKKKKKRRLIEKFDG